MLSERRVHAERRAERAAMVRGAAEAARREMVAKAASSGLPVLRVAGVMVLCLACFLLENKHGGFLLLSAIHIILFSSITCCLE